MLCSKNLTQLKYMNKYKYAKKALQITEDIYIKILSHFSQFKTEKDIYDFILNEIKKRKLTPSFDPLVINSDFKKIHRLPYKKKLKRGFCIIDMGVRYKGVCSDLTRTFFIGEPGRKELDLYEKVRRVLKLSQINAVSGISGKDLDHKARMLFGKDKKKFIHALGHGVGRKVHQSPSIHPKSKHKLKAKDIIAIEPGLYTNKWGIRIENMVYVKKNKSKVMNKLNTGLVIIN